MEDLQSARDELVPKYLVLHAVKGSFDGGGKGRHCDRLGGRLWSRLPEELVERVLLFLPLGSQLRFRCVSKRWLAILSSSRFFIRSASVRPLPMFCVSKVMSGNQEVVAFGSPADRNPASKAYCLDMSYLPAQFDWYDPQVTLQDGLICLRCSRWQSVSCMEEQFCLVNPFTKAWKQLPNLLLPKEDQEVWSVNVQTAVASNNGGHGGFNVSVLVEIREMLDFVAVYSSASDSWQITSCEAWPVAVPFDSCQHVVTGGWFCTYAADHLTLHSLEDGKMVQHARVPAPASSYRLLAYDGDIFLAGQHDTYGIWRLKAVEMRWELIASVPDAWLLDLTASIAESEGLVLDDLVNGFREGSFICMVIGFSNLLDECSRDRLHVIGFDILNSTWHVFPEHDSCPDLCVCPCYLEPKLHLNDLTPAPQDERVTG